MPSLYKYNATLGKLYAETFALYKNVPEDQKLFFYDENEDCTNFISQCVWAAYGGWIVGFSPSVVETNKQRILADIRQTKGKWFGSARNIGSNIWCRVGEFFDYITNKDKRLGPTATLIAEGDFLDTPPSSVRVGDVIQLVVNTYDKTRYGHSLYVTKEGSSWADILICCHTYDRLNASMAEFAEAPDIYPKLRIIRFFDAKFNS
ncbi:MAG: amidase domain-containing protein [Candidatus Falkowbacteria bacterium]